MVVSKPILSCRASPNLFVIALFVVTELKMSVAYGYEHFSSTYFMTTGPSQEMPS